MVLVFPRDRRAGGAVDHHEFVAEPFEKAKDIFDVGDNPASADTLKKFQYIVEEAAAWVENTRHLTSLLVALVTSSDALATGSSWLLVVMPLLLVAMPLLLVASSCSRGLSWVWEQSWNLSLKLCNKKHTCCMSKEFTRVLSLTELPLFSFKVFCGN